MSVKRYVIYCEICNYKQYSDGSDDFIEIKTAAIPREIPRLDPATNKTVFSSPKNQPKRIKCPKCGRGLTPKMVKYDNEKNRSDGSKTSSEGQPISREPSN